MADAGGLRTLHRLLLSVKRVNLPNKILMMKIHVLKNCEIDWNTAC